MRLFERFTTGQDIDHSELCSEFDHDFSDARGSDDLIRQYFYGYMLKLNEVKH